MANQMTEIMGKYMFGVKPSQWTSQTPAKTLKTPLKTSTHISKIRPLSAGKNRPSNGASRITAAKLIKFGKPIAIKTQRIRNLIAPSLRGAWFSSTGSFTANARFKLT